MKKIPIRSCLICNEKSDKRTLYRIVKNKEGQVFFDPTLRANGRGAYVCDKEDCIAKLKTSKKLEKTFQIEMDAENKEKIVREIMENKK